MNAFGGFVFVHDSVGIADKGRFRKNTNPFRIKGVADILGIWRTDLGATPLAIEVKIRKDRLSKDQMIFKQQWMNKGGIYIEARSMDDVKKALGIDQQRNPPDDCL